MMNPWVKRKWIKALRSGEYQQGRCTLKRSDSYCCLGVLAEEMVPEFMENNQAKEVGVASIKDDLVILWGLTINDQDKLADMNDFDKKTFPEIADWIEANL